MENQRYMLAFAICLHLIIKRKLEKFTLKDPEEEGWDRARDVRLLTDVCYHTATCILGRKQEQQY